MDKKISILGCGWLGLPLAKQLLESGFSVKGSTTSEDKIKILESCGIEAYLISVGAESIRGNTSEFLRNSDVLIIDIPPKLRAVENESFVEKIKLLIPFIEKSNVREVIFVSSTSVYADDNSVVTEQTDAIPETESGKQLLISEELLIKNGNFQTTILRFGGLIGNDRHPIKFLSGRKEVENPDAPINLIHQKDCIGIILKILDRGIRSETFNAVTPFHPSRKEYYSQKAVEANLPVPEFNTEKSVGKTIDSTKIVEVLNYKFLVPEL